MSEEAKTEAKPDVLPAGCIYRLKAKRPDAPHQFGVRDHGLKRYIWQSFADKAKGASWARGERRKLDRGDITAVRPLVSVIGKLYGENLMAKGAADRHQAQAKQVMAELLAIGADDMSEDGFARRVQTWVNEMMAARKGQVTPTPASPATKRLKLTIARAIVHLAMKTDGRPLRWDPLLAVVLPKAERSEKPVFSVPELRVLLSDESRYRARKQRREVEEAIAAAGGDKAEAANALGVHRATVYNRMKQEDAEDSWWLYAALGIYTGARPSEVQFLRWEWVRWDEDAIFLPADAKGNKTKMERIIPLQRELRAILKDFFKVGMRGYILPPSITELNESDRTYQFQTYIRRCGLPENGRGPHSLRHNHGALATAMKVHPMHIMLHMGHENVKVSHGYSRTATRFRKDIVGWVDHFQLR